MKTTQLYTWIGLLLIAFTMMSCGDAQSNGNKKNDEISGIEEVNNERQEVMLTHRQFEALKIKIDTLQERNMSGYVDANGQLEVPPQNEASITTVLGANVAAIEVIEGDKVIKGQTVAYLSHPNIIEKQTLYLNAYTGSEFLKKSLDRQKTLYDAGVGSGANYQEAGAKYQASRNMASGLEAQLKQLNINAAGVRNGTIYQRVALRSPIEGYVEKVMVKTGQYVDPQTNLMEVIDTHHVHADLMVFEKDVYKIKKGQKVIFNVKSIPGKELTAEIYSISKSFEQNPKAVHVHAEIENKEGNLIPGMYIQGRIQTDENKAIAFPESAIAQDGDRSFVFTVKKEGNDWSFEPMQVIKETQDGNWIAVQFMEANAPATQYAMNNAYYLMAEMKKGDSEGHSH